jgi:FRG domain
MSALQDVRAALVELPPNRYVFRGETRPRTAIHPTLGRLCHEFPNDEERTRTIRGQAYTILRWSHRIKSQVLADIDQDEWYALLRHYGWPVPLLDVTYEPEVAVWFSLLNRNPGGTPSVIYALPIPTGNEAIRVISHKQLFAKPTYRELNSRWSVQQGGALVPTGWPDMTSAEDFDMLAVPGLRAFFFVPEPTDQASVTNLLSTSGDGIATRLSSLLGIVAQIVGGIDALDPYIRSRLEGLD